MCVLTRQTLSQRGSLHQIAIPELRQNHFQRAPKSIEYTNLHPSAASHLAPAIAYSRLFEQIVLRGVVNQERRAAVYARLQHAHALFSRVPALYDNVIQFVAQKFVDNALVLAAHFNEIGQRAYGRRSVVQALRASAARRTVSVE